MGTAETEPTHFKFTFDVNQAREVFNETRIGLVSLANNHILNFGPVGLTQTKENLNQLGIKYFGDLNESSGMVQNINGKRIATVAYNQFESGSLGKTLATINNLINETDAVIVYAHWGTEYDLQQNDRQRSLAHSFCDAGADLIIGSHPHVVQPIEIYDGKPIFYSLGNFIFDQYFSEDVKERLAVGISITDRKNMEFYLVPMYLEKNGQLSLMDEAKRTKFFNRLSVDSTVNTVDADNVKKMILKGRLEIKDKACDNCNN